MLQNKVLKLLNLFHFTPPRIIFGVPNVNISSTLLRYMYLDFKIAKLLSDNY